MYKFIYKLKRNKIKIPMEQNPFKNNQIDSGKKGILKKTKTKNSLLQNS